MKTHAPHEKVAAQHAEAVRARKPDQCRALCEDYEHPAYHASMQRIVVPGVKACTRKATVEVGHLKLCAVHARLAHEGFIDVDGSVAPKQTREDIKRSGKKVRWFTWLEGKK